mgnify:FL=1
MNGVSHITCTEDVVLVTIRSQRGESGLIAGVFDQLAKEGIVIDMISQTVPQGSVLDISFTLYGRQMVDALRVISRVRDRYSQLQIMASAGNCKLQLYGQEMRDISGVAAGALLALVDGQVDIVMITTSEVDISLVVPASGCEKALELMEQTFGVSPRLL